MHIRSNHWLKAGGVAIALHAALLIGLRMRTVGDASPAEGPVIELATALPGVIGSLNDSPEIQSPDEIEEMGEAEKEDVKKPVEPETEETEPSSAEPVKQETEPTHSEPEVHDTLPAVTERKREVRKKKTPASRTSQARKKRQQERAARARKKLLRKRAERIRKKRQKARASQTRKKKKRSLASKRGNARKGAAGARRGGGGRSKANAGAVNRYASLVRARILARRPSSNGRRGTTVIVFQLSTSGGLRWARISRSSGNGGLDRKALGSVRRASPFPRPPAGSRTGQLRFSIPFRFH